MKEHVISTGGKEFYGSDILEHQTEALIPLQELVGSLGACVVSGCAITPNVGTPANYDIAAGIVAIRHADGFKIARLSAVTNVALPGHLTVSKTEHTGNYTDVGILPIAYTYQAQFNAGAAPSGADTYLNIPAPPYKPKNVSDAMSNNSLTDWVNIAVADGAFVSATTIQVKHNRAARLLYVKGSVSLKNNTSNPTAADNVLIFNAAALTNTGLPMVATKQWFPAHHPYRSTGGQYFKDVSSTDYITILNGFLDPVDGLFISFLKPVSTITNYTVHFNAVLILD